MRIVKSKHGDIFVDDDVFENLILEHKWWPIFDPRAHKYYVQGSVKSKFCYLHRAIFTMDGYELTRKNIVDHIDRNPLNNQRSNLRLVDYSTNNRNKGMARNNSSGYKGVYYQKNMSRWIGYYNADGQRCWTNGHPTARAAAMERDSILWSLFNDTSFLTFPEHYA